MKFTKLYVLQIAINNANLGRTRLKMKTSLNYIRKKKKKGNTITYRKKHLTYKFKCRGFCYLKKT